ncbi:type IA DNA topoisomerase [Paenibacillus senegalensis]|uniref:type IA DNA topoisomerase n=1 Tax=Paenibacillus senegalensis TaxID=1465766 RepID=UPI00028927D6|nr:type IA DNA topoisomerase [Paenibacillus senegalensis]
MKILVIAEKPDMGRNIARAIEPRAVNKKTHILGETYIITWAIGHLVTLAEPDHYDARYKKWNLADLPIIPDSFKLIPYSKTRSQLTVIRDLAKKCGQIVNACDAGREGQHIFSLIQRHLKLAQPVKRLWISDLTPETIRHGFAHLKDGSEYDNLTRAARARSEADWLVGMNGSRAFTTRHQALLSVGRVQTPVLALIYDRHKQIEAFTSQKYYVVEASFQQKETSYRGVWQGERIVDRSKAEQLSLKVNGQPGTITSYEEKNVKEFPFKLYDLTLLQREANGKLGFSAKKTLDIAQALYEKHKVITYPRTNSNYVNEQNIPEMHRALDALKSSPYRQWVEGAHRPLVSVRNRQVCNPAKVEDHHAILPTVKQAGKLSADEQKIYDLIVRRFLSHFYPAAEYKVHTVHTEVAKEPFKTTVKELISLGWKAIYADHAQASNRNDRSSSRGKGRQNEENEDELQIETELPFQLTPSLPVHCTETTVKDKETQPPKPYTEGTLLKAMESAGKQVEDDELREIMKESGLGTPATRAATIERLKQVGYIEMQGKRIVPTLKGCTAIELIRGAGIELLTSPEMTGQWEKRLNEIARGQASDEAFMAKVKQFTELIVRKVKLQEQANGDALAAPAKASRSGRGARKSAAGNSAKKRSDRPGSGDVQASQAFTQAAASASSQTSARASASGRTSDTKPGSRKKTAAQPGKIIGLCPREGCGGSVFMGNKGYGCSHYKLGCTFVIWKKTKYNKTLSDAMVKSLLQKGETGKLKFKTQGREYSGKFILRDKSTGELDVGPV